jgi:hypothetical protein
MLACCPTAFQIQLRTIAVGVTRIKIRALGLRNDMVASGLQTDIICWMTEGVFR